MELRQCMPATKSSEPRLQSDPNAEFDFLRAGTRVELGRTCYFMLSGSSSMFQLSLTRVLRSCPSLTANKWRDIHPQTNFHAYRSEVVMWISEDFRNTTMCAGLLHCPICLCCAAREVLQKAIDALAEAREISDPDMLDLVTSRFILLRLIKILNQPWAVLRASGLASTCPISEQDFIDFQIRSFRSHSMSCFHVLSNTLRH